MALRPALSRGLPLAEKKNVLDFNFDRALSL